MGLTTVLVSDAEKKMLDRARNIIVHNGLSVLDKRILEELKKNDIEVEKLSRGTIVALGAACILVALAKDRGA